MSTNYFLNQSGKEAFKSFIRAYDSHQLKTIFNMSQLDLQEVAKTFGFTQPPAVDLSKSLVFCDAKRWCDEGRRLIIPLPELSHKFKRPERRPGNRGASYLLNMNKEKDSKKNFKHVPDRRHMKKFVE